MRILFILFLLIDLAAAFYLFRLAFVERSNMNRKYKRRFGLMISIIVGALVFQAFNLPIACLIAGIPAGLISFFVIALAIALFTHKGPWR